MTDNRTNEPTNEELRKALNVAREHLSAIAASGEIKVWEDTGEKRGIDHQAKVWAERGERICREALEPVAIPDTLPIDEAKLAEVIDKSLIRHAEMAGLSNEERWEMRDDVTDSVAAYLRVES